MCKPISQGGQRCASHTRKAESKTRKTLLSVLDDQEASAEQIMVARDRWEAAAVMYASTTEGQEVLTDQAKRALASHNFDSDFGAVHLQTIARRGADLRTANQETKARLRALTAIVDPGCSTCGGTSGEHRPGYSCFWNADDRGVGDAETDAEDEQFPETHQAAADAAAATIAEEYQGSHRAPVDTVRLHDLLGAESTFSDDVYSHPQYYTFGGNEPYERESVEIIQRVRGNPDAEVTLYRAAPPGVTSINSGDWVAISESYARQHAMQDDDEANDWPVYTIKAKASDIRSGGNDLIEWGYHGPSSAAEVKPHS
jgi:hypothetical protein